jgi:hypothetical protein
MVAIKEADKKDIILAYSEAYAAYLKSCLPPRLHRDVNESCNVVEKNIETMTPNLAIKHFYASVNILQQCLYQELRQISGMGSERAWEVSRNFDAFFRALYYSPDSCLYKGKKFPAPIVKNIRAWLRTWWPDISEEEHENLANRLGRRKWELYGACHE